MGEFRYVFSIPCKSSYNGYYTREYWADKLADARDYLKRDLEVKRMPNGVKLIKNDRGY